MATSFTFWNRIRRTPYQAIAAVFMIFTTLFVMGVFLILASASSAMLSYFESKPKVTIFFKDQKDKASIDQLSEKLKQTGKIASVEFISKEQALATYKEQNKNDPLLLEMVTADILPASLEVSATSPNYLTEIAEIAKKEPDIDEVVLQKDVIDTLLSWTSGIRNVGSVLLLFLSVSTFFIILTSIGMKIALRRQEIDILKLVGATPWYIKRPFVAEGLMYGLLGATTAWFMLTCILLYIRPFIVSFLRGIPTLTLFQIQGMSLTLWPFHTTLFFILWAVLTCAGLFIGFIGSMVAISRYMRY
jgi:cell division transport system permease protein